MSIANRYLKGNAKDLEEALKTWKAWNPPKMSQGLQQGGVFVFDGYNKTLYSRKDGATGDHADLSEVLAIALSQ